MKWGERIDRRDTTRPGWREDPDRPGVDRYWTGSEWDDSIAPRSTPDTTWMAVLVGLLAAALVVYLILQAAR